MTLLTGLVGHDLILLAGLLRRLGSHFSDEKLVQILLASVLLSKLIDLFSEFGNSGTFEVEPCLIVPLIVCVSLAQLIVLE